MRSPQTLAKLTDVLSPHGRLTVPSGFWGCSRPKLQVMTALARLSPGPARSPAEN